MQRVSRVSVGEVVSVGSEDNCDSVLGAQLMVRVRVRWRCARVVECMAHATRRLAGQFRGKHALGMAVLCGRSGLGAQVRARTSDVVPPLLPRADATRVLICASHSSRIEYEHYAKTTKSSASKASTTVCDQYVSIRAVCERLSHRHPTCSPSLRLSPRPRCPPPR